METSTLQYQKDNPYKQNKYFLISASIASNRITPWIKFNV